MNKTDKQNTAAPQAGPPIKDAGSGTRIDTTKKVGNDGKQRLPHERDQAPDAQSAEPKEVMQQAKKDLDAGLVDTDMHGKRGVEEVVRKNRANK